MRVLPGEEWRRWLRSEWSVDCALKHSMALPANAQSRAWRNAFRTLLQSKPSMDNFSLYIRGCEFDALPAIERSGGSVKDLAISYGSFVLMPDLILLASPFMSDFSKNLWFAKKLVGTLGGERRSGGRH